jgi:hypothetical protein
MKGRKVFISYAHEDYPRIQQISSTFKASNDLIWLDRISIMPGDVWREKIQKASLTSKMNRVRFNSFSDSATGIEVNKATVKKI